MHDVISFDAELGKTLKELHVIVCRKQYLESNGDNGNAIADLRFRGAPIEDLGLDFTLPGYPDYVLKPGDENVRNHVLMSLYSARFNCCENNSNNSILFRLILTAWKSTYP